VGQAVSGGRSLGLRSALWLALGGWVGSWALFALVIARLAFRVLPSPEVAGHLVAPVLNGCTGTAWSRGSCSRRWPSRCGAAAF
jgi:hypothetical protein